MTRRKSKSKLDVNNIIIQRPKTPANVSVGNSSSSAVDPSSARQRNFGTDQSTHGHDLTLDTYRAIFCKPERLTRGSLLSIYTDADYVEAMKKVNEMFTNQGKHFRLPKFNITWTIHKIQELYEQYQRVLTTKMLTMQPIDARSSDMQCDEATHHQQQQDPLMEENQQMAQYFQTDRYDEELIKVCAGLPRPDDGHECNWECRKVPAPIAPFQELLMSREKYMSRFLRPLYFGFYRDHQASETFGNPPNCFYWAPCGRKLFSLSEVSEFLTNTHFPPKYLGVGDFTFSPDLRFRHEDLVVYNFCHDISNGREARPIVFFNSLPGENYHRSFKYIVENTFEESIPNKPTDATRIHVDCPCLASMETPEVKTNRRKDIVAEPIYENKLLLAYYDKDMARECGGINCPCDESCPTRVASLGMQYSLALKMVPAKGLGVFTLHFIPRGAYLGQYIGHIETDFPESSVYNFSIFIPDHLKAIYKSMQSTTNVPLKQLPDELNLNSEKYGNYTRFFNHSCDPNLFCQPLYFGNYDARFPKFCFFAIRDILPGDELTWDYNSKEMLKNFNCNCGSANCRINPTVPAAAAAAAASSPSSPAVVASLLSATGLLDMPLGEVLSPAASRPSPASGMSLSPPSSIAAPANIVPAATPLATQILANTSLTEDEISSVIVSAERLSRQGLAKGRPSKTRSTGRVEKLSSKGRKKLPEAPKKSARKSVGKIRINTKTMQANEEDKEPEPMQVVEEEDASGAALPGPAPITWPSSSMGTMPHAAAQVEQRPPASPLTNATIMAAAPGMAPQVEQHPSVPVLQSPTPSSRTNTTWITVSERPPEVQQRPSMPVWQSPQSSTTMWPSNASYSDESMDSLEARLLRILETPSEPSRTAQVAQDQANEVSNYDLFGSMGDSMDTSLGSPRTGQVAQDQANQMSSYDLFGSMGDSMETGSGSSRTGQVAQDQANEVSSYDLFGSMGDSMDTSSESTITSRKDDR